MVSIMKVGRSLIKRDGRAPAGRQTPQIPRIMPRKTGPTTGLQRLVIRSENFWLLILGYPSLADRNCSLVVTVGECWHALSLPVRRLFQPLQFKDPRSAMSHARISPRSKYAISKAVGAQPALQEYHHPPLAPHGQDIFYSVLAGRLDSPLDYLCFYVVDL